MKSVGTRFLLPFGVLSVLFSVFVLYRIYDENKQYTSELIRQQAAIAMEFNLAIRDYAANKIRPVMEGLVDKEEFIPETMSTSFISRSIFEDVRRKFPNMIIRFASDNPRNPINRATPDELRVIDYFRKNPQTGPKTEEIQIDGRRYLALFTPRWLKAECMRCHGEPRDAPASLLKRYGTVASFHRTIGDIAALDTVAVPVETIASALASNMRRQSVTLVTGLAILFGLVLVVFRVVVTGRLTAMANHFHGIADNPESPWMTPVRVTGNDEISVVGGAFNKLVEQLRMAYASLELRVSQRTNELAQTNEELRREIAEREQAEEALRQSEDHFRRLTQQSPVPIATSNEKGDIEFLNDRFVTTFGYTLGDIPNMDTWSLQAYPQEDYRRRVLDTWNQDVETAARTGKEIALREYRVTCKDGTVRTAEILGTRIGNKNLILLNDITERKHAEEENIHLQSQLLQAQKMEAIGTLAGGVAHDFNNILMALMGYASLVTMGIPKDHPVSTYVEQILACTGKAANLTQSLLAFSRKQVMALKPHKANIIVKDVEKLLRRLLTEDIELDVVLGEDVTVMADMAQMNQVLMNLVTNARDAMPRGGKLEITTGKKEMDNEFIRLHGYGEPGIYALISVTDNGMGMDQKTQEKIFEPFFTTKDVGKGTGLGLAIVYGIVKQHNGYISVQSMPDKGTVFQIYLPAIQGTAAERESAPIEAGGGTETLLFAEDNPDIRRIAKDILGRSGYTVIEAVDGQDAVEKFAANKDRIALIIIDVVMPRKNGKEACEEIQEIRPGTKVLFISGYTADVVLDKGIPDQTVDYLSKPLSPNELLKKVREVLDR